MISFRASPMTASPKPKWCVVSRHQRCIHLLTQHGSTSNPLRPLSSSAYTTPPRLSCKLYTPPRQKLQQPPFCQSLPEQPTSTRSSRCSTIRLRSPPETPFVPTSHFSCHTSCPQRRGHLQATRGRGGLRGARGYSERTPLLRPPAGRGVHSEDEDEDSQGMSEEERTMRASALRREEEAVFGKWPWRIFNRHVSARPSFSSSSCSCSRRSQWWWWHVEPVFCCCADDEYEDF